MKPGWRYIPPNVVTCIGLTAGLLSIAESIAGRFEGAAWLVVLCVLLDKLDGGVARLLKASSQFGLQMDSLSDLITFGVAPAVLVLCALTGPQHLPAVDQTTPFTLLVYVTCFFWVIASALRLAKFNVVCDQYGEDYFFGVPTTAAGAVAATSFLTAQEYGLPAVYLQALPGVMLAFALLMVSRVPLPKLARRKSKFLNIFQWINISLIYVCGLLRIFPEYILTAGLVYLLCGSGHALLKGIRPPQLQD